MLVQGSQLYWAFPFSKSSLHLELGLFLGLTLHLPICPSVCLVILLPIHMPVHSSVFLSVCTLICLPVCIFLFCPLPIRVYVHSSIFLSICSVCLPTLLYLSYLKIGTHLSLLTSNWLQFMLLTLIPYFFSSCGMMVNYRYFLESLEKNSSRYLEDHFVDASEPVLQLVSQAQKVRDSKWTLSNAKPKWH